MEKNQIDELHRLLVNTVIKYIIDNDIKNLEEVQFSADNLQGSAEFGSWHPCTDSYLGCYEYVCDDNDMRLARRHLIGESM